MELVGDADAAAVPPASGKDFWTEYFIQTRREIDGEKSQRQLILNFIFLGLGGLLITAAVRGTSLSLTGREALALFIALTAGIVGLFLVRAHMLQNVANRWFSLLYLLGSRWLVDVPGRPYVAEIVICNGLLDGFWRRRALHESELAALHPVRQLLRRARWLIYPPAYRSPDAIISGFLLAGVLASIILWWFSSAPIKDVYPALFWAVVGIWSVGAGAITVNFHYRPLRDRWVFRAADIVPVDGDIYCSAAGGRIRVDKQVQRGEPFVSCLASPRHKGDCAWKYARYEASSLSKDRLDTAQPRPPAAKRRRTGR